jgi:hypothetical protein
MKRIIYKTPDGGVAVLVPSADCLQSHTVEEIALKDVPAGLAFKIVDESEIPNRDFRNAWEADMTNPDGVGAESNEFVEAV